MKKKNWRRVLIAGTVFFVVIFTVSFLIYLQKDKNNPEVKLESKENRFETVLVSHVIDGDTVVLDDGRHLRYIGIDTPELNIKSNDLNEKALEAKKENEKMVLGRQVVIEKDTSEFDKYGRTLCYVWVDGKMVNEELVKLGVATLMTISPNIKYSSRLKSAHEKFLGR